MKFRKIFNNKTAKGVVSLLTIVIVLVSVLASTIYYNNSITGNVVKETSAPQPQIQIKTINDINELSQFNEGWYAVRNGIVYYLEGFNSYVPLYVRITNNQQQNGFVLVEADGNVIFDVNYDNLLLKKSSAKQEIETISTQQYQQQDNNQITIEPTTKNQQLQTQNQITGAVTGLESVTGMQTRVIASNPRDNNGPIGVRRDGIRCTINSRGCFTLLDGRELVETCENNNCRVNSREISSSTQSQSNGGRQRVRAAGEQQTTQTATTVTQAPPPPPPATPTPPETSQGTQRMPITNTLNTGTQPVLYKQDGTPCQRGTSGCTIELGQNQILVCDVNNNANSNCRRANNFQSSTSPSTPTTARQQSRTQQEPIEIVRDGNIITVTQSNNMITITGRDPIPSYLLNGVDWARYDGSSNFPLPDNGIRTLTQRSGITTDLYSQNDRVVREKITTHDLTGRAINTIERAYSTQGERVQTSEITTTPQSDGSTRSETRTRNQNGNLVVTSEQITFADGSRISSTYTASEQRDRVIYTSSNGRTVRLSGADFNTLQNAQGSNLNTFLGIAAQEGFRSPTLTTQGVLVQGDRSIRADAGNNIWLLEDNQIRRQISGNREIVYSGDVTYDATSNIGRPIFGRDSTTTEYTIDSNGQRRLINTQRIRNDQNGNLIESTTVNYNYDSDGNINNFRITHQTQSGTTTLTNVRQINEPSSPFNGMYEFTTDSGACASTCYMDGNTIYRRTANGQRETISTDELSEVQRQSFGSAVDQGLRAQGLPSRRQQSTREFFADVERTFTEFRGLGYFATYFFSDSFLSSWRENVDRAFASLYLGSEYWESEICASNIDSGNLGFVYAETPQGIAQVAAHIEGTRTAPINTGTSTEYLYVITFEVKNGETAQDTRAPEEMKIKVRLKKQDGQFVDVFDREKTLRRGETWKRAGNEENGAIVDYSSTLYAQICLEFDHIPSTWQLPDKRLCNNIPESTREPTTIGQAEEEEEEGEPSQNDF